MAGLKRTLLAVSVVAFTLLFCSNVISGNNLGCVEEMTPIRIDWSNIKAMYSSTQQWLDTWAPLKDMPRSEQLRLLKDENAWKNDLVLGPFMPEAWIKAMPHTVATWLRCWVACAGVYFAVGGIWCYYTYFVFGSYFFKPNTIPNWSDVLEQIKVSNLGMPLYALLPAAAEWAAEVGYTMAYPRIDNVGLPRYVLYFFLYMTSVEFFVYWAHRLLHEVKWAYRLLHHVHHKYNKEHTLSPMAGLAFHPLDGILQASPYAFSLFFIPMHFLTHEMLLFATGIWTTNIHDCIHGKVWPILGAGYHTIHHTNYKTNYGHYFIFMDWMHGTMQSPEQHEAKKAMKAMKAQ